MSKNRKRGNPPKLKGSVAWLGPSPLLPGESAQDYQRLLDRVTEAVRPQDTIEEILLRDVIDLTWEVLRWRRLRDTYIAAHLTDGLRSLLVTSLPFAMASDLAKRWGLREPEAIKQVDDLLVSRGLTMDAALANTFAHFIKPIEAINHLLVGAEARRNLALREIERRRAALASATARALHDIEEAECRAIDAPPIALEHSSRDETA